MWNNTSSSDVYINKAWLSTTLHLLSIPSWVSLGHAKYFIAKFIYLIFIFLFIRYD